MSGERICSLLPSATEIVCALGLEDRLVAVTHECDYPPSAAAKPHITRSTIDPDGLTGREIDAAVRESLSQESTLYHLDAGLLERLQPDLVLTQELCEVCAVGPEEVRSVMRSLSTKPRMLSLEPRTLDDVLDTVLEVGYATGVPPRATEVTRALRGRLERVREAVSGAPTVPVLTLEWIDPLFVGGHWVPQMVEAAGGRDVLGRAGVPSRTATWEEVAEAAPEVIVVMPCGFGLERSRVELDATPLPAIWDTLPAVVSGRVFVVDGSSYFNRPGPRLVDGVEILAGILHPELWPESGHGGWSAYSRASALPGTR